MDLIGCLYEKKLSRFSPVNRVPRFAGMISIFICMRSFIPLCRSEYVTWYCFDFSSAIITLNSAFILGLSASTSNPIKATCDLQAGIQSIIKSKPSKTRFSIYLCYRKLLPLLSPYHFQRVLQHAPFLFL